MKNTILIIASIATVAHGQVFTETLDFVGTGAGTHTGTTASGINYTLVASGGFTNHGNGDLSVRTNQNLVITFSTPVFLGIEETIGSFGAVSFDSPITSPTNVDLTSFVSDAGSWTVTNNDPVGLGFNVNGTSVEGGSLDSFAPPSDSDWGQLVTSGAITQLTFTPHTNPDSSGLERFNFSVSQTGAIPEPSSTALLGLGGLALLARRKR